jgi:alpha-1,6-mannosyltransferase
VVPDPSPVNVSAMESAVLEPTLARPRPWSGLGARLRDRLTNDARVPRTALAVMVGAGAAVVLLAAQRRSALVPPSKAGFNEWLVGPLRGAASFVPDDPLLDTIAFSTLVAVMVACWLVMLAGARRAGAPWVLGAIATLHAILLLGPPLPLTDVFNYVNYARLDVVHGLNPYTDVPALLPGDPSYGYATWHHLLSPYGPLFTILSYAIAPLGLAGGMWVLKLLTVSASLGCLYLVWRLAERRGQDPLWATAFVGLNPLVLVYGVGGVHNDFFMLLAILLGVAAVLGGRPAAGGAAMVTAAALKMSGGLILPFAWLGSARSARRPLLLGAAAAVVVLGAASALSFGLHLPGLETQSKLVTPLSPQNLFGLMLGQGGSTPPIRAVVFLGLVIALLFLLRATWRGADWVTMAGWATLALVVSLTWEMPWYVLWVLPFAAIGHSRALRRAAIVLTAFLALTLLPVSGYLLSNTCHCYPGTTKTGKRNADEIRRYLK